MTYKLLKDSSGTVGPGILMIDGLKISTVPNDPNNRDWVQYQEWLAAGNQPDPAD
jgi:hypothetical protein